VVYLKTLLRNSPEDTEETYREPATIDVNFIVFLTEIVLHEKTEASPLHKPATREMTSQTAVLPFRAQ
jgi:hypothetical protein